MKISELQTQIDKKLLEIDGLRKLIWDRIFDVTSKVIDDYPSYENKFYRYIKSEGWEEEPYLIVEDLKRRLKNSDKDMIEIFAADRWDTNYFMVPRKLIENFLENI